MFGFELAAEWQPWVALGILVVMFVLFVRETYPVEVVAVGHGEVAGEDRQVCDECCERIQKITSG